MADGDAWVRLKPPKKAKSCSIHITGMPGLSAVGPWQAFQKKSTSQIGTILRTGRGVLVL
eukprot:843464-Amphidinium_carterae.1